MCHEVYPPPRRGTCAHHRVIGRLHGEQPNWRLQRNTLSPSGHTRPWRLSLPKSASSSRAPSRATHAGRTFPVNQVTATGGPGGPRWRVPATRANPRHVHVHVYFPSRQDAQGTNTAVPWRHTDRGGRNPRRGARSCMNVNVCPVCPVCVPAPPGVFLPVGLVFLPVQYIFIHVLYRVFI